MTTEQVFTTRTDTERYLSDVLDLTREDAVRLYDALLEEGQIVYEDESRGFVFMDDLDLMKFAAQWLVVAPVNDA